MALDFKRDRSVDGMSDRTYGDRIMVRLRRMNYTDLYGEARLKGVELAEKAKILSWSRNRPGEHDDKHTNEELLEALDGMAEEFETLHNESDEWVTTKNEAYAKALEEHDKAVEAEEERRVKGERPPAEHVEPAASAQPA